MPGRFVDGEWTEESDSSVGVVRSFTYQRITDVNRNQGDVGGPRKNVFRELLTAHRGRNDHGPSGESNGQVLTISPIEEESASLDLMEMSAGGRPEAGKNLREGNNGSSDGTEEPNESDVSTVEPPRNKRGRYVEDDVQDNGMEVESVAVGEIPAEIDPGFNKAEGNEGNGDNEESEGNSADDASSYAISSTSINSSSIPRCTDHVNYCQTRPSCVNYWMQKLQQCENSGERKKISAAIKTAAYCAEKYAKIQKMEAEIDILRAQSQLEHAKTQLLQAKIERHRRRHARPMIPE